MLVVAIIALLSAIALPKFANLVTKAKEANVKGNLATMRSAMNLYYVDNDGFLPNTMSPGDFWVEKYIDQVPRPVLPGHRFPMTNMLTVSNAPVCAHVSTDPTYGNGAWLLCRQKGVVIISCLHTDTRGTWISEW